MPVGLTSTYPEIPVSRNTRIRPTKYSFGQVASCHLPVTVCTQLNGDGTVTDAVLRVPYLRLVRIRRTALSPTWLFMFYLFTLNTSTGGLSLTPWKPGFSNSTERFGQSSSVVVTEKQPCHKPSICVYLVVCVHALLSHTPSLFGSQVAELKRFRN